MCESLGIEPFSGIFCQSSLMNTSSLENVGCFLKGSEVLVPQPRLLSFLLGVVDAT